MTREKFLNEVKAMGAYVLENYILFPDKIMTNDGDKVMTYDDFDKFCEYVLPSGKTVGQWIEETEELTFHLSPNGKAGGEFIIYDSEGNRIQ